MHAVEMCFSQNMKTQHFLKSDSPFGLMHFATNSTPPSGLCDPQRDSDTISQIHENALPDGERALYVSYRMLYIRSV